MSISIIIESMVTHSLN